MAGSPGVSFSSSQPQSTDKKFFDKSRKFKILFPQSETREASSQRLIQHSLISLVLINFETKAGKNIRIGSHVCLVVTAYLLDPDVIFGVYEGLSGGVGLSECYHAGYVLKIVVVVYLDLEPSHHKNMAQTKEKKSN